MKIPGKLLATLFLAGGLSSCATLPVPQTRADDGSRELIERIRQSLPGTYSNFSQVNENNPVGPVTDLDIRQLYVPGEPVFLFTSQQRDAIEVNYDIYWLKLNPQSKQAEFHFSRLTGSELSLSLQDTLAIAWQRVLPGCAIVLRVKGEWLQGHSQPDACRFEDPYLGETRIYRMLALGAGSLEMETAALIPGELHTAGDGRLIMNKHRKYTGTVSLSTDVDPATNNLGEWLESSRFNIFDDGRVNRLYGGGTSIMGYAVQLARLPWRAGEPPYLRLAIVNLTNGEIQAYQWLEPGFERIELNLDWVRVELEATEPEAASRPAAN